MTCVGVSAESGTSFGGALVASSAGDPVAGAPGMVPWPTDQPGSCHQESVPHSVGGLLFAGHLRLAILGTADLVPVRCREQRGGLVSAGSGVRGVDVAGGDVRPMPRPIAKCRERAANHAGLPRHLNDSVPVAVAHRVVRRWLPPVHGH